jgi:hypothetical protein
LKQWLAAVLMAGWPIGCGVLSLSRGKTLLMIRSFNEVLTGDAATSLAIAYLAIGCFIHFHYFWGLSDVLWPYSQTLKLVPLVIAAPAFIYALWRAFGWQRFSFRRWL